MGSTSTPGGFPSVSVFSPGEASPSSSSENQSLQRLAFFRETYGQVVGWHLWNIHETLSKPEFEVGPWENVRGSQLILAEEISKALEADPTLSADQVSYAQMALALVGQGRWSHGAQGSNINEWRDGAPPPATNCWDFCLFVRFQQGALTAEQVQEMYQTAIKNGEEAMREAKGPIQEEEFQKLRQDPATWERFRVQAKELLKKEGRLPFLGRGRKIKEEATRLLLEVANSNARSRLSRVFDAARYSTISRYLGAQNARRVEGEERYDIPAGNLIFFSKGEKGEALGGLSHVGISLGHGLVLSLADPRDWPANIKHIDDEVNAVLGGDKHSSLIIRTAPSPTLP